MINLQASNQVLYTGGRLTPLCWTPNYA